MTIDNSIIFGFIFAMLFCIIFKPKSSNQFYNTLNHNEKNIFDNIFKERRNIYLVGFLIGFIISFLLYFNGLIDIKRLIAITLTIQYFVYQIYPKQYFNSYITDKNKFDLYNSMNNDYKTTSHIGFIIGILIGLLIK